MRTGLSWWGEWPSKKRKREKERDLGLLLDVFTMEGPCEDMAKGWPSATQERDHSPGN